MTDSIILLGPIEVEDGTDPKCVNDDEPYKNFTDPILGGNMPFSVGGRMPNAPTGDNVFNVYQAEGSEPTYSTSRMSGSIKFGVTPCAEKIDIQVVGRADTYGAGFDTLNITIDGVLIKNFQSDGSTPRPPATTPFSNTKDFNETVTHNFTTPEVCGHIVDISGRSGSIYNNNVGYDVKITVTLRTSQI